MAVIKEKRSAQVAELEKQKEENLQIKLSIIEELKELVESGRMTLTNHIQNSRNYNSSGMKPNWFPRLK